MNRIEKWMVRKGTEILAESVPSWLIRRVFGENVDTIEIRNNIVTLGRLAGKL